MSGRPARRAARWLGALLLVGGALLGGVRCDLATQAEQETLVVEAFVETGAALPPVTLRQTKPLSASADSAAPATGATVTIQLNDTTYAYEEVPDAPGRYRAIGGPDSIAAGTRWRLTARWQEEVARAQGRTPSPIQVREMCVDVPSEPVESIFVDSLRLDSLDIPAEQRLIYPIGVTVRWQGASTGDDTTRWVRGQLRPSASFSSRVVNFFLQPAEVRREDRYPDTKAGRKWRGVYAVPVDTSTAPLPEHRLTAVLVRGDTAFADFARTRADPDRREPVSNVSGGLGIATGVAIDSLRRTVTEGTEQCRMAPR
jgi:hypothetical protein